MLTQLKVFLLWCWCIGVAAVRCSGEFHFFLFIRKCSGAAQILQLRLFWLKLKLPSQRSLGSAYSWSYAAPPVWLMVIKLRRICLLGTRFAQIDSRQIGRPSPLSSSSIDFVSMPPSNIFPLFAVGRAASGMWRATIEEIKWKNRRHQLFPPLYLS